MGKLLFVSKLWQQQQKASIKGTQVEIKYAVINLQDTTQTFFS